MAKVTNISQGPRGAYLKGVLVMAEPGETIDADDYNDEWFGGAKSQEAKATAGSGEGKKLKDMNKAELLKIAEDAGIANAKNADGADVPVAEATNKQLIDAIEAARQA